MTENQVVKNSPELLDLNTDEQLYKGLDSSGSPIQPGYTGLTKSIKKAKGQPANRVTLKDTGDFYDGFYLKTAKFPYIVDSKDEKTEALESKYGSDIFGLSPENKEVFAREILLPYVQDDFRKSFKESFKALR